MERIISEVFMVASCPPDLWEIHSRTELPYPKGDRG
jgi:hypothetical protein